MKSILKFSIVLVLLCGSSMTFSADNVSSATTVVDNYMTALMAGDLGQAKKYLAPDLLKQRQALFNNPGYSQELLKTYGNAVYQITGTRLAGTGRVEVDVEITLSQLEIIHTRFTLAGSTGGYQIISEQ